MITFGILSMPMLAGSPAFKMYDVRSGKITYTLSGGNQALKIRGKKRRIFDQYGYRELIEEARVQTMNIFGQKQKEKTHTLDLRTGKQVTHADFGQKTLTKLPAIGLDMLAGSGQQNLTPTGEAMLRKMGGRKIGTEKIAGYTCDVWKMPIATQCLYHGVPLKIVSNVMGVRQTEIATEAAFDIAIPPSSYQLPAFRQKVLPPEVSGMFGGATPQDKSGDMGALLQAAAAVAHTQPAQLHTPGASGQDNTMSAQEAAMADAMLPMMKQQILQQKSYLMHLRTCLKDASSLSQAKACDTQHQGNDQAQLRTWDTAQKSKTLRQIDAALKQMSCIEQAKTIQEMERCEE